jgi:hypothetical protein
MSLDWHLKEPSIALINKLGIPTILTMMLALFGAPGRCGAQTTYSFNEVRLFGTAEPNSVAPWNSTTADQLASSEPGSMPSPQVGLPPEDSGWHFAVSPYLWFPGVHGTVGALGRDVSVHATPGDLLSNFRFGLMGLVEARYKRVVLPLDLMWVRLGDDNALPFPNLMVEKAKIRADEFLLTPKVGFLLLDQERLKVAALAGFRYWYFGENLKFVPSNLNLNLNFSSSQNWVDPVVGGRIQGSLMPRVIVTIAGDVGGWDTGSHINYQASGFLGFQIKPKVILQVGYRYLAVDYRNGGTRIDLVTSGVTFGVTMNLK